MRAELIQPWTHISIIDRSNKVTALANENHGVAVVATFVLIMIIFAPISEHVRVASVAYLNALSDCVASKESRDSNDSPKPPYRTIAAANHINVPMNANDSEN